MKVVHQTLFPVYTSTLVFKRQIFIKVPSHNIRYRHIVDRFTNELPSTPFFFTFRLFIYSHETHYDSITIHNVTHNIVCSTKYKLKIHIPFPINHQPTWPPLLLTLKALLNPNLTPKLSILYTTDIISKMKMMPGLCFLLQNWSAWSAWGLTHLLQFQHRIFMVTCKIGQHQPLHLQWFSLPLLPPTFRSPAFPPFISDNFLLAASLIVTLMITSNIIRLGVTKTTRSLVLSIPILVLTPGALSLPLNSRIFLMFFLSLLIPSLSFAFHRWAM